MLVLLVALAPGFFGDIDFVEDPGVVEWLAVDYTSKLLRLAIVLAHPELRRAIANALRPAPIGLSVSWAALPWGLTLLFFIVLKPWLDWAFPSTVYFVFPRIESTWLYAFDMTFGLGLTAVAEEVLYRALLPGLLAIFGWRPWLVILGSSLLFGLDHWSLGVGNMVGAFLAGVLLMIVVRRTGSLLPAIGAHYAIDAVLFA